jgi:hypothetical protein
LRKRRALEGFVLWEWLRGGRSRRRGGTMGRFNSRGRFRNVLVVVYLVIGAIVANSHHYFAHMNGVRPVASAVLAVVLWPLLLLGVRLHIK